MYGGFLCSQAESCCHCLTAVNLCTIALLLVGLHWQCKTGAPDAQHQCAPQKALLSLQDYLQRITKWISESWGKQNNLVFSIFLQLWFNSTVNKMWPLGSIWWQTLEKLVTICCKAQKLIWHCCDQRFCCIIINLYVLKEHYENRPKL